MTWRLNYLVTTLPRVTAEVALARGDWEFHYGRPADARKIGYGIPSPVTQDNRGKEYLCELVETHYNAARDELIFVWKPMLEADELPEHLRHLPDQDPTQLQVKYAGEQHIPAKLHAEPEPAGS